jgi:predicted nucleic acid-binding protein
MVRLELLYGARDPREFAELREDLDALTECTIGAGEWRRALDVYGLLAAQGGAHSGPSSIQTS